ncbi:MAG: methyltransferase domain-containing protein [Ignavibacteriae bacterium]|nr:methyltransferase domain-containing protein [Ignavibacteriota bacterium]
MKYNIGIFQCPLCKSNLDVEEEYIICRENGHRFDIIDDIPIMFTEGGGEYADKIVIKVKKFYEENPFPNYDDTDNPSSLINKAEASVFAKLLNDGLPFNIKILEVGCGTGQLSNYLSLANRRVFGIDISLNSLFLANNFKRDNSLKNVSFYQMNLFKPIFKDESFDAIICNGVLHHTHEAYEGMNIITKLLKNRGFLIIGLYNRYGRLFTKLRKPIFRLTGNRLHVLDPYLSRTDLTDVKKNAWFLDQYHNPHETTHSFGEVLEWFSKSGIEFISSIPVFGNIAYLDEDYDIFLKKSSGSVFSRFITQIAMPFITNKEGGFFVMIGRKNS